LLEDYPENYIIGLGVSYKNGADGTTKNLVEKFPSRLLDVPVSELSFTGMAVGMASQGLRPIVHHGRIEFALLALDQILTQAARWNFMFGGDYPCPVTFRICIGRQWGNGPQHTANYHSIFLQTPGLNVLIPYSPKSAYEQLNYAVRQTNPSVYLEHRWLYKSQDNLQIIDYKKYNDKKYPHGHYYEFSNIADYLVVTYAEGAIEALKAANELKKADVFVNVFVITSFIADARDSLPKSVVIASIKEIIMFDTSPYEFGILAGYLDTTIINFLRIRGINLTKMSAPFSPSPTAPNLGKNYYPTYIKLIEHLDVNNAIKYKNRPMLSFDDINLPPNFNFSDIDIAYTEIHL
jgi:pyruvate dehydrogenase E1 component beta subunit